MRFAVFDETKDGETRVALVPDAVKLLLKKQHSVSVAERRGPGRVHSRRRSSRPPARRSSADAAQLAAAADCLLRVRPVTQEEAAALPEGKALIGFLAPLRNPELVQVLAQRRITSFSLDAIPRITPRAKHGHPFQHGHHRRLQGGAAGGGRICRNSSPCSPPRRAPSGPSQALILGAGVAGLQAIATARRLGAVVEAFDVRPAVKEQIKSLGATFIEIPSQENLEDKGGYAKQVSAETLAKQQKLLHERAKVADFIISTAQVPGKPAPRLITKEMVADMKPGSVIVDLAAESGGNCELTQAGQTLRAARRHHPRPDQPAGDAAAGRQPHVRPEPGQLSFWKSPTKTDLRWIGKMKFSPRPASRTTAKMNHERAP